MIKKPALMALALFIAPLLFAEQWIQTNETDYDLGNYGVPALTETYMNSIQLAPRSDWWDPVSTPAWWDTSYRYRMQVTVSNNSTSVQMPDNYTVMLEAPLYALASAGKLQNDADDLRVARFSSSTWTELDRVIDPSNGISFDGVDDYCRVAASSSLSLTTKFTIESWIYLEPLAGGINVIAAHQDKNQLLFCVDPADSRLVISLDNDSVSRRSASILAAGEWYHVAAVYEGSSSTLSIFVNGLSSNGTLTGAVPASLSANTSYFNMGGSAAAGEYFHGRLDDVRLSNSVRYTASFVPSRIPFATDSNTVGLWHFDEEEGASCSDSSSYINFASFVGEPYFCTGYYLLRADSVNRIWFKTPFGVVINQGSFDCSYYLHYGNTFVSNPPDDPSDVFYLYDDFEGYADTAALNAVWSDSASTGTGEATLEASVAGQGGSSMKLYDDGTSSAAVASRSVTSMTGSFIIEHKVRVDSAWTGTSLFSFAAQNATTIVAAYMFGYGSSDVIGYMGASWTSSDGEFASERWNRMRFIVDRTTDSFDLVKDSLICVDDGALNADETLNTLYFETITSAGGSGVMSVYVDDFRVRKYITPGETTSLGGEFDWQLPNAWSFRRKVFLQNNSSFFSLPKGYSVMASFDHQTMVDAETSLANGDDIRLVYQNGSSLLELNRKIDESPFNSWNSSSTGIWFKTPVLVATSTTDSNYYLYYGCSNAANPPSYGPSVFLDDFDFESDPAGKFPDRLSDMSDPGTYQSVTSSAAKFGSRSLRTQSVSGGLSGGVYRQLPAGVTDNFEVRFWAYGKATEDFAAGVKSFPVITGDEAFLAGLKASNHVYRNSGGSVSLAAGAADDTWYLFVIRRFISFYDVSVFDEDGAELGTDTGVVSGNSPVYSVLQNYNPNNINFYTYYDNFRVRKYLDDEPTVSLSPDVVKPYNTAGTYFSQIRDTGSNDQFVDEVTWMSTGSTLTIEIRASNDKSLLSTNPTFGWLVVASSGDDPADIKGRYVQYKASFAGTGANPEPKLDQIIVGYNLTPFTPANTLPVDTTTLVTLSPTLTGSFFYDPNTDAHAASQWQIRAAAGDFGTPVFDSGITSDDLDGVTIPLGILADGGTYFWRVRYMDENDGWESSWSAWSEESSFSINVPDVPPPPPPPPDLDDDVTAPFAPVAVSPIAGAQFTVSTYVALDWSDVTDDAGVTYEVQVDDTALFEGALPFSSTAATSSEVTSALSDGTYYWRVRAFDAAGNYSAWSDTAYFVLNMTVDVGGDGDGDGDGDTDPDPIIVQSPGSTSPDDPIKKACFLGELIK